MTKRNWDIQGDEARRRGYKDKKIKVLRAKEKVYDDLLKTKQPNRDGCTSDGDDK